MLNKILPLIVLLISLPAQADNGEFTYMVEGQGAPFKGTLFDDEAMSHLLTLPDYYETQCDLELEYNMGLLREEYQFKINDLNSSVEFLEKEKEILTTQKDSRIELLEEELRKKSKNDKPWIFGAGIAIGIGLTYGIVKGLETNQ